VITVHSARQTGNVKVHHRLHSSSKFRSSNLTFYHLKYLVNFWIRGKMSLTFICTLDRKHVCQCIWMEKCLLIGWVIQVMVKYNIKADIINYLHRALAHWPHAQKMLSHISEAKIWRKLHVGVQPLIRFSFREQDVNLYNCKHNFSFSVDPISCVPQFLIPVYF
jgi:hypothetical protein